MRNKVLLSTVLKNYFLFAITGLCWLFPVCSSAQIKKDSSFAIKPVNNPDELKIRQRGSELLLQFPPVHFRSALKIVNTSGSVMKAVMIDEGMESVSVSLAGLPKGIYQCVIVNRTQRFIKKIVLQY